jgi:hypothetical protein
MLALDEICDGGVLLEADPAAVVARVAIRTDDIPLGEQTVAQVCLFRFKNLLSLIRIVFWWVISLSN